MSMSKPIIAGNWKMFKTVSEAVSFVEEVKGKAEVDRRRERNLCAFH